MQTRNKLKAEEEYKRKLAIAFATWRIARVTRQEGGFRVSLEEGTLDNQVLIVNTGNHGRNLKILGFIIGTRQVESLICDGDLNVRPLEPSGEYLPYPETMEEELPPDPGIEAFLKKSRLLYG